MDLVARAALRVGSLVDVLDTSVNPPVWRHAQVIGVVRQRLTIHYTGWPADFDHVLERSSERIQRSGSRAVGDTGPKSAVARAVPALIVESYAAVEFADPVPSHLECAICTEAVMNPPNTPCGHLFCRGCLAKCRSPQCPTCRKPFSSVAALPSNTFAQQLVWNLKAKCSVNPAECPWRGELGTDDRNLKAHHLVCTSRTQPCDLCREPVQIRAMAEHKAQCPASQCQAHCDGEPPEQLCAAAHYLTLL